MLRTKKQILIDFFNSNNLLQCPICGKFFSIEQNFVSCDNHHSFDISKQGYITLLKSSKLNIDKHYDKYLFDNRRKLIETGFFAPIESFIQDFIKSQSNNDINVLDLGSGEGSISKRIQDNLQSKSKFLLLDYSKIAIKMCTDYLSDNLCCIVADLSFLPIKDKSIDYIINFLSPINPTESIRVLSESGFIIKVIPTENYLKEFRQLLNKPYLPKVENNLLKSFQVYDSKTINYEVKLNDETKEYLKNMTPLMFNSRENLIDLDSITVELKVLILKAIKK